MLARDPFETECGQIVSLASSIRGKALILNRTSAVTLSDVDLYKAKLSLRNALRDIEQLIADRSIEHREAAQ